MKRRMSALALNIIQGKTRRYWPHWPGDWRAAGGGWLMNQYRADIRANQVDATLLRARHQADAAPCGQPLCANVEMRGVGVGDRQQYRRVLPRALPASAGETAASLATDASGRRYC
ncbi:MAG: hypothetical protein LBL59_04045 [Xanthomonadaceae bacterium]|jgi:hypothetical protein|nr:hypothetical protein [Xanthomonadaceae bacterium]